MDAVKTLLTNPKTNEIIHFDNYIQMVRSMIIVYTMLVCGLDANCYCYLEWTEKSVQCTISNLDMHTKSKQQLNDHCFSNFSWFIYVVLELNYSETSKFHNLLQQQSKQPIPNKFISSWIRITSRLKRERDEMQIMPAK